MLIDSHCHLQSLPPDERDRALDEARERGVAGFLVPAIRFAEADELLALCHRHDDVWCALGCHPHHAADGWQPGDDRRLAELATDPKVVAVGECGLDFHYDHSPRDVQGRVMREQWRLALELGLPVVVHNRDSNEAMLAAVAEPELAGLAADFHSFAGGRAMAEDLIARGFYLGFTGMITFRAADNVREVIPLLPPDRELVETDTPFLAPVPHRGKPNRPAYVVEVARRLAEERGETYEETCRRTGENFLRLFARAAPAA
ncbi:MAG TPA: TatD family hydrolase [Thermoanaerobaculia bacterium]|nr:TatD family hydrolase [Thermoanaerobaculia bacterium]